jgi:hypothetical protein
MVVTPRDARGSSHPAATRRGTDSSTSTAARSTIGSTAFTIEIPPPNEANPEPSGTSVGSPSSWDRPVGTFQKPVSSTSGSRLPARITCQVSAARTSPMPEAVRAAAWPTGVCSA